MATYRENLVTSRNQVAARLAEVTAEQAPTYSIDGKNVSWESYASMLSDQLEKLDRAIQHADHPFWKVSRARA